MIKQQHGSGWAIREQSGKVKLSRRWAGGSSSAMLDLPWASRSATAVLGQIESISTRMSEAKMSLAPPVGPGKMPRDQMGTEK